MRAVWNGHVVAESDRTIVVDGNENKNAAWTYPAPKEAAEQIKDHVAFWRGVEVAE